MKTVSVLTALAGLTLLPASADQAEVHGDPYIPVGTLDVDQTVVRTGVRPLVTWNITYPTFVDDLVEINPDDSLEPKVRTRMDIRVVGAAFQVGSNHTPLALQCRAGASSSWEPLFLGNDAAVHPTEVLHSQVVDPGTRIDFAAQAQTGSGSWYSSRDTQTENPTVMALRNGDPVPYYVPAYEQGDVASFLSQYISSDNRITIGPRDVIYLYELYSTNPNSSYFDMQDMVVVVTFSDVEQ